jgi:hypothetical protein
MQEDLASAEIREVRRRISEPCDHDPRKLIAYYKELQQPHEERLLRAEELIDSRRSRYTGIQENQDGTDWDW